MRRNRLSPISGRADGLLYMLITPPPASNAQRQREFCARNPGYYRKYAARRRAMAQRAQEEYVATLAAAMAAEAAAEAAKAAAETATDQPLTLPAPAQVVDTAGIT